MERCPFVRGDILAPLLGVAATLVLSGAAVVAIAVVPDAVLPGLAAPARQHQAPQPAADARAVDPDAGEAGYPSVSVDSDGNAIAHWYFEEGTRDHLWYFVFN